MARTKRMRCRDCGYTLLPDRPFGTRCQECYERNFYLTNQVGSSRPPAVAKVNGEYIRDLSCISTEMAGRKCLGVSDAERFDAYQEYIGQFDDKETSDG